MAVQKPFDPAQQMVRVFKENNDLLSRLKSETDPITVLQEAANTVEKDSRQNDRIHYRIAAGVFGALTLIAAVGAIVLVAFDKITPDLRDVVY